MSQKYIFGGIILASVAGFVYLLVAFDLTELYEVLASAHLSDLVAFVLLAILMLFGFTLIWREFVKAQGIDVPLGTLFNFRMAGFAVSYVTPGPRVGGEVIRANMAEPYGSFSNFVVTSVMEMICIFLASIGVVVVALLLAPFLFPSVSWYVFSGTMLILLIAVAILRTFYHSDITFRANLLDLLNHLGVIPDQHEESVDDFFYKIKQFFTTKKPALFRGLAIAGVCKVLLVGQLFFLLRMVDLPATVLQAFLLAAAIEIAYAIPGYMGIGFLEAGQVGVLALFGLPAGIGVITAVLTRGRDLLASGYGFLALSVYSSRDGL